jgi:hypothetical protein
MYRYRKEAAASRMNRVIIGLLSVLGTLIGFLLIVLSRFGFEPFWKDLLFGMGLALAPSGVIGLIGDYLVFGRAMDSLNESNESLGTQVEALRISTDFLKQSSNLGLEMIYPDRESALQDFAPIMREQAQVKGRKGKLIIVGSSIKGLVEVVRDLQEIIKNAIDNEDCELRILLTHPKYSRFRENQEERPPGAIEDEIFASIRLLEETWDKCSKGGKEQKPIHQTIKLYKGTPTCFMIIAGDRMLINPYPYEKEAYRSFCLSVRQVDLAGREEEMERSIYQQYYSSHFEFPWKRNALPYKYYLLEGPIPDKAWNKQKRYGDVFVVQDSGEFYIAIYLLGEKDAQIRGVPTCIPYAKEKGGIIRTLDLGNKFSVRLLEVTSDPSKVEWVSLDQKWSRGFLELDDLRRSGKFSAEVPGNLINEYEMIGLFEEENPSPFFHALFAERDALREEPLPLFYYWLEEKPEMPPSQPEYRVEPIEIEEVVESQEVSE